ncbi:MAG: hypothetical protein H6744_19920 [Deltaproteobacteria bacterium]|nr:hypothetical protein [Deltaproteobacteria bacterium]MCB9788951.1 hypothetical protein [Deltaproteobacteria bacterium]
MTRRAGRVGAVLLVLAASACGDSSPGAGGDVVGSPDGGGDAGGLDVAGDADVPLVASCEGQPAGSPCDDGDPCTLDDRCQSGICAGGENDPCDAEGPCRAGTCQAGVGCVYSDVPDATSCDVACYGQATCQSGKCQPVTSTRVVCPASTDPCVAQWGCEAATGACTLPIPAPEGTTCDLDADKCSLDACDGAGNCVASGQTETCAAANAKSPCWTWTCTAKTGCIQTLFVEGISCSDGNPCTVNDTCLKTPADQETCLGTPLAVDDQNPCTDDACVGGVVVHTPVDGVPCDPDSPCSALGTCSAGACVASSPCACTVDSDCAPPSNACDGKPFCDKSGAKPVCGILPGTAIQCPTPADPCRVASCDAATGSCGSAPGPNGLVCDDGNPCTTVDTCLAGVCTGAVPLTCAPGGACEEAGVCDPASGSCKYAAKAPGAACSDGDPCTQGDACLAGACVSGAPVTCPAPATCEASVACDSVTGACVPTPAGDGAACDDGDPCSAGDGCVAGLCEASSDAPDGTPCGDGLICQAGQCLPPPDPPDPTQISRLAVGSDHVCFVRADGSVACWGRNDRGQLGIGRETPNQTIPVDVIALPAPAVSVSAGRDTSCALLEDATLWCWGWNSSGQLGVGTTDKTATPDRVLGLSQAAALAVGGRHACAISADQHVYCWGPNLQKQLGDPAVSQSLFPHKALVVDDALQLASGFQHSCALREGGVVSCWGDNPSGQAGQASPSTIDEPTAVAGLSGVTSIAAGLSHTCAVASGGVQCWGSNGSGQLGSAGVGSGAVPVAVKNLSDAVQVAAGDDFACAVRQTGAVVCWGQGTSGQLGDGGEVKSTSPVTVAGLGGKVEVAAGPDFACALGSDERIDCWGNDFYGQLGDGTTEDTALPVAVVELADHAVCGACDDGNPCTTDYCTPEGCQPVGLPDGTPCAIGFACSATACTEPMAVTARLAVGNDHAVFARDDGSVVAWGANDQGQLGLGETQTVLRTFPRDVPGLQGVVGVTAREDQSCAVRDDGSAACWGNGSSGELGDGTGVDRWAPSEIIGGLEFADVRMGDHHACGLTSEGRVYCWGWNVNGQLGKGGSVGGTALAPTPVVGLVDAVALAVGEDHSCAIRAGGRLVCWGDGSGWSLGNGLANDGTQPVDVAPGKAGLVLARAVVVGVSHTCALTLEGGVACWGEEASGALGLGNAGSKKTPATVTISGVEALAAGRRHVCALKTGGTLACWGTNAEGQVGNGDTVKQTTPVAVPGLTGVTDVAGGLDSTCARRSGGEIVCWGGGSEGQLGDGTTDGHLAPAPIIGLAPFGACGVCDDEDPCTTDACAATLACEVGPDTDGLPCAPFGACASGVCGAGPDLRTRLAAGASHTCAVRADGSAACFGDNTKGQLGVPDIAGSSSPVEVPSLAPFVDIDSFERHTCAVTDQGRVVCWGLNDDGQLGNGGKVTGPDLVEAAGLAEAIDVSVGSYHTCALSSGGQVHCWGRDFGHQVGNGPPTADVLEPFAVPLDAPAVQVVTGDSASCAVLSGGSLRCWGDNVSWQLGDGTDDDRIWPAAVAPGSAKLWQATAMALGLGHACALRPDGTLACWGDNGEGKLGGGPGLAAHVPRAVPSFSGVARVAAGHQHTCVIQTDQTLACWGANFDGQIGTGDTATVSGPTTVAGLAGVTDFTLGEAHTCAIASGTLYCWGRNDKGQLGLGTSGADVPTPTAVVDWP